MRRITAGHRATAAACLMAAALAAVPGALAEEEDYGGWEPLQRRFESTGGGGVVIDEYDPVVVGDRCVTDFTATLPDGTVLRNTVEFDAVAAAGGTLCTNGRWRARDGGGASGTTPLRVFIRDGVRRRSP